MMGDGIDLLGDKQLQRTLSRLTEKVQGVVQRKAVTTGATLLVKATRAHVPVHEGNLKKSIDKKVKGYQSRSVYVAIVGPKMPLGAHGHIVEFGTVERFHKRFGISGLGKSVGVMPANPFMRPAWDATKGIVADKMAQKMAIEIEREAARAK